MKQNYYFLAASLPELSRDARDAGGNVEELLVRCADELNPEDFISLKSLFLFNDIQNIISYHKPGDAFISPSFYSPEELAAGREEPSRLMPFLARHLGHAAAGARTRPRMREADELALELFSDLGDIPDDFVRAYYMRELDLRNIAVALTLRKMQTPLEGALIPFGAAYEAISESAAEDFGLSDTHPYLPRLLEAFGRDSLTARERALDEALWQWLEERLEGDFFSSDYIMGYLLKLRSVERWRRLREDSGSELLEELLTTVRRSVRFAIEFSKAGQGAPA